MLHVRTQRRSGAYASSRQDTEYAGAGVSQEFRPRVCYSRYGLPGMDVRTRRFEGLCLWSGPQVVETTSFGYRDV